ncbi:hypothetical protein HSX37_09195|uniref:YmaF family protein n=1 Tax=Dendrosporobacter quercicolus TaxID=146817 RepID=A0A1G9QD72_9FIRM|nr:YmaF family protein [Dendrosporobacter quercicolus]NSL48203.1 hypothetical protein [Dendrosporobacter quercicolus DSM 1736]SDM08978.1 YmaF family protein [Dendrosporobacter quercicolus]
MSIEEDRKKKKGASNTTPQRDSRNHNHTFLAPTDIARSHQHIIVGTTSPAIETGDSHVHRIYVRTSYDPKDDDGHWHMVDVTTGAAIEVPGDEHTHYFDGETSYDLGHRHCFDNITASITNDAEDC